VLTCKQSSGITGSMTRPRSRHILSPTFRFRRVSPYMHYVFYYPSKPLAYNGMSINATGADCRCRCRGSWAVHAETVSSRDESARFQLFNTRRTNFKFRFHFQLAPPHLGAEGV